jgi:hypothetical protein
MLRKTPKTTQPQPTGTAEGRNNTIAVGSWPSRLMDLLPRALNTRRRYSAFRPMRPPLQDGTLQSYTSITDSELANLELMEKGNLFPELTSATSPINQKIIVQKDPNNKESVQTQSSSEPSEPPPPLETESPKRTSDLEQFLSGHYNELRHKRRDGLDDNKSVSFWMTERIQK